MLGVWLSSFSSRHLLSARCQLVTSQTLSLRTSSVVLNQESSRQGTTDPAEPNEFAEEEFRTLQVLPPPRQGDFFARRFRRDPDAPPVDEQEKLKEARHKDLPTDVDWNAVWPTARSFHPATVPLPVRMGYIEEKKAKKMPIPSKWANMELTKIPNFLHLTPSTIKRQCQALKKFCTQWPAELTTDEECEKFFPVEIVTSDYLYASPSLRDPRTRTVVLRFNSKRLNLDPRSHDKFKRLVGPERYNTATDEVTIVADSCPMKAQNYEYAHYLMTASYFESKKVEDWESSEKEERDWERFFWEKSPSKEKLAEFLKQKGDLSNNQKLDDEFISKHPTGKEYVDSLTRLYDEGESSENLQAYKESVKKLLFSG